MTTTKNLMLAAIAALTLAVGAAQAQNLTNNSNVAGYVPGRTTVPVNVGQVQSGSSDPVNSTTGHQWNFGPQLPLTGAGGGLG